MQEIYNLLSFWLDDWKRRLETPREMIFERSFVNVARAAAFSLEENYRTAPTKKIQRSAKGWGRKLLELLEETYAAHDPAIELLKLEHKTKVEEDDELRTVARADSELTDWSKDVRVLVNHQKVARLLTLIPDEKAAVKNYVENYRDYLQRFVDSKDELLAEVDQRRGEYRFKLFLLKDLRNRMAHQALYFRPDIILYAEELQEIFENLLRKIADVGLMTPPPYATVTDYIDNYEQLWIS